MQAPTGHPNTDSDGFLTKEQVRDTSRFHFDERIVEMPELGGGKLLLRGITLEDRDDLTRDLPDDPRQWRRKHTALSLSKYVSKPQMSFDEWLATIKPWPAAALDRINSELAKLISISEEDEAALAQEFPSTND